MSAAPHSSGSGTHRKSVTVERCVHEVEFEDVATVKSLETPPVYIHNRHQYLFIPDVVEIQPGETRRLTPTPVASDMIATRLVPDGSGIAPSDPADSRVVTGATHD